MKNRIFIICLCIRTVHGAAPAEYYPSRVEERSPGAEQRVLCVSYRETSDSEETPAILAIRHDNKSIHVRFIGEGSRTVATLKTGEFLGIFIDNKNTVSMHAQIEGKNIWFATPLSTFFLPVDKDNKEIYWWLYDPLEHSVTKYLE